MNPLITLIEASNYLHISGSTHVLDYLFAGQKVGRILFEISDTHITVVGIETIEEHRKKGYASDVINILMQRFEPRRLTATDIKITAASYAFWNKAKLKFSDRADLNGLDEIREYLIMCGDGQGQPRQEP